MSAKTPSGVCVLAILAAIVGGCENDQPSKMDELVSAAQEKSSSPVPEPRPGPNFKEMPSITIDNLGAYIGGHRASELGTPAGRKKLREIVAALPIKGEKVTITAIKKASVQDVFETTWELGKAGAPKVIIKTEARNDLPKELEVTPQSKITEADACSIVATVTKVADTGVWAFKGGIGRRHRKGFAGPDLSNTGETIEKDLKRCKSDTAFFSAAYNMPWEHAFAMGGLIKKGDEDGKIAKLVLLGDEPVAGRKVELRK
jgi:biopolymer transport protein ExbD